MNQLGTYALCTRTHTYTTIDQLIHQSICTLINRFIRVVHLNQLIHQSIDHSISPVIVAVFIVVCTVQFIMHCPIGDGNTHTHTKSTNKHKQETKMFHSLVSAMATKGATHPSTETVHVLASSTMTQESGVECTGRYSRELPADLLATWAEGAIHPDHDTSDDSNREYCAMPSAHV